MCGIVGQWRLDGRRALEDELARARDTLTHRGPDDAGIYLDGSVGFGHRRLSIIDLSPAGRMPMFNETRDVWAVFNGEIYNFRELRNELLALGHVFQSQSDGEVIVHAYETWGVEAFLRFDGMFAIAIWDARSRKLILARDAAGEKPLYYYHRPGQVLLFGSTLSPILSSGEVPREVDDEALRLYASFGFVPAPLCIVRGVRKVQPGAFVVFTEGEEPQERKYWNLENVAESRRASQAFSLERATDELQEALRTTVRSRMISDVPLGAFLSGGVDSSLVVALMAELNPGSVRTFTIGFREQEFDESEYAHRVAKHLGVENTTMVLSANQVLAELPAVTEFFDEPMADYSVLPSLAVARLARRHVTVALTGDGADESFGGYRYYAATRFFDNFASAVPHAARASVARHAWLLPGRASRAVSRASVSDAASYFGYSGFYRGATAAAGLPIVLPTGAHQTAQDTVAAYVRSFPRLSATEAGMLWDATHTLPDAWLAKVDRTSMAVALETRAPFLARSVLEYAFRLPLDYRVHGLQKKIVLRKVLSRYLPDELVNRPKQGFTAPLKRWFKKELRDELHDRLAASRVKHLGFFSPEGVQTLLREQAAGTRDHTQMLWALFHLDRWFERYIQGSTSAAA